MCPIISGHVFDIHMYWCIFERIRLGPIVGFLLWGSEKLSGSWFGIFGWIWAIIFCLYLCVFWIIWMGFQYDGISFSGLSSKNFGEISGWIFEQIFERNLWQSRVPLLPRTNHYFQIFVESLCRHSLWTSDKYFKIKKIPWTSNPRKSV